MIAKFKIKGDDRILFNANDLVFLIPNYETINFEGVTYKILTRYIFFKFGHESFVQYIIEKI